MDISLRPDLQQLVDEKVRKGEYQSIDDAVNEGLNLLRKRDDAEARLESLLLEAEESGPASEITTQDWADIERDGIAQIRGGIPA